MPFTVNEDFNTGGITTDVRAQESTAVRTFTVFAYNVGFPEPVPIASTELEAVEACEISTGDAHPEYSSLFCTEFQCTREPNHLGLFRVKFTYRSDEIIDPEPPPPPGGGGGQDFTGVNVSYNAQFEKLWRLNANPNATPYAGDATAAEDIGGIPLDTFGEIERSTLVTKGEVSVTMNVQVNVTDNANYLTGIQEFIGTRNSSKFLGAAEGNLLYLGATSRRTSSNTYEVTHNFKYDEFKHQEQIAKPGVGPFGKEVGDFDQGDSEYRYNRRAYPVWWVQPFPRKSNFVGLGINIG